MEVGNNELHFLDLKIKIVDGVLSSTVYSKPTDSHMYLHASSCHQPSSVKGIQKGVALRLRRICSSVEEFNLKSKEYMAYLVARGHSPKDVKSTFETIGKMSRQNARKKRESSNASNAIIFQPSSTHADPMLPK